METWKQRFSVPVVAFTALASNNLNRGMAISDRTGISQIHAWDVRTGHLRQLTDEPAGMKLGQISPDGRYVYYLKDDGGNEVGHYVRIPFEGGQPEDITPGLPAYSSHQLAFCRGSSRVAFTLPERGRYHLYRIDEREPGVMTTERVWSSEDITTSPVLSFDGTLAAVASRRHGQFRDYSLLLLDLQSGEILAEVWDGPGTSIIPHIFSPVEGDNRLLAHGTDRGSRRPLLWDATTQERTELALEGLEGDVSAADWSKNGRRLLLMQQTRAQQHLYTYDLLTNQLVRLTPPPGIYDYYGNPGCYFTASDEIWSVWQDASHPASLIALDGQDGKLLRTILPAGPVPAGHVLSSVEFSSSDGQAVQGWLGLPDGRGPFPTIIEMHGGPDMAVMNEFSPRAQAWTDAGYAFLTVNFRGSTSFGRKFQQQIWGDQGHWEVEDIVAARGWLVGHGIAHPNAIFLTGWSYGGYLTLLALGRYPELWAGGMGGHVISDWATQYATTSSKMAGAMVAFFGGTPAEKADLYRAASPITYVDNVRAPVLIIQATNDTRTTPDQASVFAERLRQREVEVQVHWTEGGHGQHAREMEIQYQAMMMQFAERIRRGPMGKHSGLLMD